MFSFNNTQKTKSLLEANIMLKEIQVDVFWAFTSIFWVRTEIFLVYSRKIMWDYNDW